MILPFYPLRLVVLFVLSFLLKIQGTAQRIAPFVVLEIRSTTQDFVARHWTNSTHDPIESPPQRVLVETTEETLDTGLKSPQHWESKDTAGCTPAVLFDWEQQTEILLYPTAVAAGDRSSTPINKRNTRLEHKGNAFVVAAPIKIKHLGPYDNQVREYGTITSSSGQVWLDRNIGASQRATSPRDTAAYGDYFRWTEINASGPYAGSGVGKICPTGFRLPNVAEWLAEFPSIIASNDCAQNAFNHLFLPLAGYRSKGMAGDVTTGGSSQSEVRSYLWSSSTLTSDAAQRLFFSADGAGIGNDKKSYSYSVRCLKE